MDKKNVSDVTGSSNSQLQGQKMTPSYLSIVNSLIVERGLIGAYIDRLTITGNLSPDLTVSLEPWQNYLLPWENIVSNSSGGWRAKVFPDFPSSIFCEFVPDEIARKRGQANFRIECNPNKLYKSELDALFNIILPDLENVGISRLDLAFDFERNLSEFRFSKSVSGARFWGKDGATQTIYYGSPTSSTRIRLYDKKTERLAKGDLAEREKYKAYDVLWRLEYELHGRGEIGKHVRQGFHVLQESKLTKQDLNLDIGLSAKEKIMLSAYETQKDLFKDLSKNTKAKYKDLSDRLSTVDLTDGLREVIKQIQFCYDYPQVVSLVDFCNCIYDKKNILKGRGKNEN